MDTIKADAPSEPVCAELVEAPSLLFGPGKKVRPFDKLRADGF
jgi:hypothetical protein